MLIGTKEEDIATEPAKKPLFMEDMSEAELAFAMDMPGGLENLGNTSYINTSVQCWKNEPELKNSIVDFTSLSDLAICICPVGYDGELCEMKNPCFHNPCSNSGVFLRDGESFTCMCTPPYIGDTCRDIDACWNHSCSNNGKCVPENGQVTCLCKEGYIVKDLALSQPAVLYLQ
ncbi:protein delta homolog 1-like isoform X2 [Artemia franciscana]|uniref:protein delta homolog 1-like isoform X2 n=1 Tax=Artemia franciscana TaxID=6661 RepID=UPI0032DAD4D7